jgi:hypothetical protein
LIALVCATSAAASGAWLSFDGNAVPGEPEISVLADSPSMLHLRIAIPGILAQDRETPDGLETYLTIPGHGHTLPIGAPAVPMVNFIVEVPFGAQLDAQALAGGARGYSMGSGDLQERLYPTQPPMRKIGERDDLSGFQRDLTAYQKPGLLPDGLVTLHEMGEMRGHRLLLVRVSPVAYDAAAGELLCHNGVDVMIRMSGADLETTRAKAEHYYSPPFDHLLAQSTINHHTFLGGMREFPALPIGLLVITADALHGGDPLRDGEFGHADRGLHRERLRQLGSAPHLGAACR